MARPASLGGLQGDSVTSLRAEALSPGKATFFCAKLSKRDGVRVLGFVWLLIHHHVFLYRISERVVKNTIGTMRSIGIHKVQNQNRILMALLGCQYFN